MAFKKFEKRATTVITPWMEEQHRLYERDIHTVAKNFEQCLAMLLASTTHWKNKTELLQDLVHAQRTYSSYFVETLARYLRMCCSNKFEKLCRDHERRSTNSTG